MPRSLPTDTYVKTAQGFAVRRHTPEELEVIRAEARDLEARFPPPGEESETLQLTPEEMAELRDPTPEELARFQEAETFQLSPEEIAELRDPTPEEIAELQGPDLEALKEEQRALWQEQQELSSANPTDEVHKRRIAIAKRLDELDEQLDTTGSVIEEAVVGTAGFLGEVGGGIAGALAGPAVAYGGAVAGSAGLSGAARYGMRRLRGATGEEAQAEAEKEAAVSGALTASLPVVGRVLRPFARPVLRAAEASGVLIRGGMQHLAERPSLTAFADSFADAEAGKRAAKLLQGIEDNMPMAAARGEANLTNKAARLSAGGSVQAEAKRRSFNEGFDELFDTIEEGLGGRVSQQQASEVMDNLIRTFDEGAQAGTTAAYRALDDLATQSKVFIDVRPIRKAAIAELQDRTISKSAPTKNALEQLSRIGGKEGKLTFEQARRQIDEIRAAIPEAVEGHPSLKKGKHYIKQIREAMKAAAEQSPELKSAFEEANRLHAARMEVLDAQLIRRTIEEGGDGRLSGLVFNKLVTPEHPDAVKAFRTLAESMAADPKQAQLAKKAMQGVRGAFFSDLVRTPGGAMRSGDQVVEQLAKWDKLLEEIYPDKAMREGIKRMAKDLRGVHGGIGQQTLKGAAPGSIATVTGAAIGSSFFVPGAGQVAIAHNVLGALTETAYGRKVLTEALRGDERALLSAAARVARGLSAEPKNRRKLRGNVQAGAPEGL